MTWVTFSDMRAAKFCSRGTRSMFERYGIDISKVIKDGGIDADELNQKTGGNHAMVGRVIEIAEAREHG